MTKYKINEPSFYDFTIGIRSYFDKSTTAIHKARNELKIIPYNDIDTVVKSFKIPNIIRRIFYTYFRDSKAKKSYIYSLKIKEFTPKPISYIEFYKQRFLWQSYFISEKFAYDFTIREPLLNNAFADRENILKAFARFTLSLHNADIFHKDYSPGNILIKKTDNGYIFKIVDVNRMKFKKLSQKDRARGFAKLWADNALLKIIANEYALHYDTDKQFEKQVLYFSNKNKNIKNIKKKLKGLPVND